MTAPRWSMASCTSVPSTRTSTHSLWDKEQSEPPEGWCPKQRIATNANVYVFGHLFCGASHRCSQGHALGPGVHPVDGRSYEPPDWCQLASRHQLPRLHREHDGPW